MSSATVMTFCAEASAVDAEILALWSADVALASRLGWPRPVPLLAVVILQPSLRRGTGSRRPRPFDEDFADTATELKARPYEIVLVAGGYQFRTRPRHAEAMRSLAGTKDAGPPSFTRLEMLALAAIAYRQPVTRAELSRLTGHDISRDILSRLKTAGVIAPRPRAPELGAPIAWVTIQSFLEVIALGSLRDIPDLCAGRRRRLGARH